jgi:hypothetical protein
MPAKYLFPSLEEFKELVKKEQQRVLQTHSTEKAHHRRGGNVEGEKAIQNFLDMVLGFLMGRH